MQITEDNTRWAIRKLSRFTSWRGFPQDLDGVNGRARCFLRLVHNRTVREILTESAAKNGITFPPDKTDWKLEPDLNDADWILDLIEDTLEEFPLPVQMRRLYFQKLPPSTTVGDED